MTGKVMRRAVPGSVDLDYRHSCARTATCVCFTSISSAFSMAAIWFLLASGVSNYMR